MSKKEKKIPNWLGASLRRENLFFFGSFKIKKLPKFRWYKSLDVANKWKVTKDIKPTASS